MNQHDSLKQAAAIKAVEFVPENEYIGIGTGSTVNFFIHALAQSGKRIKGAVSTSAHSSQLMAQYGIPEIHPNETLSLAVYIDGADEINHLMQMIKGGGGAHLSEKIAAQLSKQFICIADERKYVSRLGSNMPIPVEVIPMARSMVSRQLLKLGGQPQLRLNTQTRNGNEILDVYNLNLNEPLHMENKINQITGVVENGIFAHRPADVLILAQKDGVQVLHAHP